MSPNTPEGFHENFSHKLLAWYRANKRDLPWRNTRDPYKIWLSEIILQQTRVKQGLPYYERIVKKFPNIFQLAEADIDDLLKLWQGLGYYSRARNLHACSRQVVQEYNGKFPDDYESLLKLKGIGKYTAAAIGSMAYGLVVPVVDGNVFRVISRVFGIEDDIAEPKSWKVFFKQASDLIDKNNPGQFNQSLMEFGAINCLPTSPKCQKCIFEKECFAMINRVQGLLPVKRKKVKVKNRYITYLVIQYQDQYMVRKRGENDIWAGLYDFVSIEKNEAILVEYLEQEILKFLNTEFEINAVSNEVKHILTHRIIYARFVRIQVSDQKSFESLREKMGLKSCKYEEMLNLPHSVLVADYLKNSFLSLDLF